MDEFLGYLSALEPDKAALIDRFRTLVLVESEIQNLTKILKPKDFYDGHIKDCLELVRLGWLGDNEVCGDLGSGAGVPGIVLSVLVPLKMVLIESEKRKAAFLTSAVSSLGLKDVEVIAKRAEKVLSERMIDTVLIRAVGSLEKLLDLTRKSSTWNRLILFKGPSFEQELDVLRHKKNSKFNLARKHTYQVGDKTRILVEIIRLK